MPAKATNCRLCNAVLASSENQGQRYKRTGGLCQTCFPKYQKEYMAKWKQTHSEQIRENMNRWNRSHAEERFRNVLKYRYDLTPEEFQTIWQNQKGACAICERKLEKRGSGGYAIDHDHSNGVVRGILCLPCNRSLFYFEDENLKVRIESYLRGKALENRTLPRRPRRYINGGHPLAEVLR